MKILLEKFYIRVNRLIDNILRKAYKAFRYICAFIIIKTKKYEKLYNVSKAILKNKKPMITGPITWLYSKILNFIISKAKDWEHCKYFLTSMLILLLGVLAGFSPNLIGIYAAVLILKMLNAQIQVDNTKRRKTISKWWYIAWIICPFLSFLGVVFKAAYKWGLYTEFAVPIYVLWILSIVMSFCFFDSRKYKDELKLG